MKDLVLCGLRTRQQAPKARGTSALARVKFATLVLSDTVAPNSFHWYNTNTRSVTQTKTCMAHEIWLQSAFNKNGCKEIEVSLQYKLIGCHRMNGMTLIRADDMYNVSPQSWIGNPDISSLGPNNYDMGTRQLLLTKSWRQITSFDLRPSWQRLLQLIKGSQLGAFPWIQTSLS